MVISLDTNITFSIYIANIKNFMNILFTQIYKTKFFFIIFFLQICTIWDLMPTTTSEFDKFSCL